MKISKSSLGIFQSCKRKYFYGILGYEREFDEESERIMTYGKEFHKILEDYNQSTINSSDNLKVPLKYLDLFNAYKVFVEKLYIDGWKIFGYEMALSNANITGIIDLILKNGDDYLIIDYKTIIKMNDFNSQKYSNELAIYKHLLSESLNIPFDKIKTAIVRLVQNGTDIDINFVEIDKLITSNVLENVDYIDNFISNNSRIDEYEMVDKLKMGYTCRYCEFYKICK